MKWKEIQRASIKATQYSQQPHFTMGSDIRFVSCTCVNKQRCPLVVLSWLRRFLMSVRRSCGTLKMICYTPFRECYSQNSTVLWNPHLNEFHNLWKVRMLTPALQIDKLCHEFITGGLLEVRWWVISGTTDRIQLFCYPLTLLFPFLINVRVIRGKKA